jgi:phosphotransferase system HPr-like phosphotransfer protein
MNSGGVFLRGKSIIRTIVFLLLAVPSIVFVDKNPTVTYAQETGDSTPPVISNVKVTQGEIEVGELVTVTATVKDNQSKVNYVEAQVMGESNSNSNPSVEMRYDSAKNLWIGSYLVKDTTAPGRYNVQISASDEFYNNANEYSDQSFTVINPKGDYTGPEISNIKLNKTEVNSGDKITFSATVVDKQSKVALVNVLLSNDAVKIPVQFNSKLNKWVGSAIIPNNIPDGEKISIQYTEAYDMKGNRTLDWENLSFTVHNPKGDFSAPQLKSLEVKPSVAHVGEKIQFKAKITDNSSGVKSVWLRLDELQNSDVKLSFDKSSGYWVGSYNVKTYNKTGKYRASLNVEDHNGNHDNISTNVYVKIENPKADLKAPVFGSVTITSAKAKPGDVVKISATISDNVGVFRAEANLEFSGYDRSEYIPLKYNTTSKKWEGTYKVKKFELSGIWPLSITAYDKSSNQASPKKYPLEIVNSNGNDTEKPYVNYIKVTPATAKPGDTVHLEVKLGDNKSGVKEASVYITNETMTSYFPHELTYNKEKHVWFLDYKVQSYTASGLQSISLDFKDNAGNMQSMYYPNEFIILNDNPDYEEPKVENLSVSSDKLSAGDVVTFKAKVTDNHSGVKDVSIFLVNPDLSPYAGTIEEGYWYFSLKYDKTQRLWVGTYTVKPSDPIGEWWILFTTRDYAGNSSNFEEYTKKLTIVEKDTTPPTKPVVKEVSDKTTVVTGTTEANAKMTVKVGTTVIGKGTAGPSGKFSLTIPKQKSGTTMYVSAADNAGNTSMTKVIIKTSFSPIKVQLNDKNFSQGYSSNNTTYVNWNALKTLKLPYTYKGNGIFLIGGRNIEAEKINHDWYIQWKLLAPGKITYKVISGGYNFIVK